VGQASGGEGQVPEGIAQRAAWAGLEDGRHARGTWGKGDPRPQGVTLAPTAWLRFAALSPRARVKTRAGATVVIGRPRRLENGEVVKISGQRSEGSGRPG